MSYANQLDVTLTGSGFIAGVIYVLRLLRDWSSARRSAAAARRAEAMAEETRARARQAWNQADGLRWLIREAQAGRWHVSPVHLLNLLRPDDFAVLNRLTADEVMLTPRLKAWIQALKPKREDTSPCRPSCSAPNQDCRTPRSSWRSAVGDGVINPKTLAPPTRPRLIIEWTADL
jgi:hypothetical protein